MEMESCVPPGFRFHPTEEELVGYYLKRKVNSQKFDIDVIIDIDVYRMEPWDIQERCRLGYEEQTEWYFFSHKDKKYPTGTRTNRATAAGFWKATGRDKAVLSKNNRIIGMRKTLVFYRGRSPNGRKTDWIMHEYRLQTAEHSPPQEEGWVVCRAFKKPGPNNHKQGFEAWNNHAYYVRDTGGKFRPPSCSDTVSPPMEMVYLNQSITFPPSSFGTEQEQEQGLMSNLQNQLIVELPQLDDSASLSTSNGVINKENEDERSNQLGSQYVDWKILDDLLSSQPAEADKPAGSLAYSEDFPLISQEYELNAQSHASHIFTCQLPHL